MENQIIEVNDQKDENCTATLNPLSFSVYNCSCCSAYYNIFDLESDPLNLRNFLLRPCNYCRMPKPSDASNSIAFDTGEFTLVPIEINSNPAKMLKS